MVLGAGTEKRDVSEIGNCVEWERRLVLKAESGCKSTGSTHDGVILEWEWES